MKVMRWACHWIVWFFYCSKVKILSYAFYIAFKNSFKNRFPFYPSFLSYSIHPLSLPFHLGLLKRILIHVLLSGRGERKQREEIRQRCPAPLVSEEDRRIQGRQHRGLFAWVQNLGSFRGWVGGGGGSRSGFIWGSKCFESLMVQNLNYFRILLSLRWFYSISGLFWGGFEVWNRLRVKIFIRLV